MRRDLDLTLLQGRPTCEGPGNGRLIRVFELTTNGQAGRDPRYGHPERLDRPRDVHRGRLTVHRRAGRDDDLTHPGAGRGRADPAHELGDAEVVRPHTLERGE